jgi:hypothetical protein
MLDCDEIQKKFPKPVICLDNHTEEQPAGCYCVLGAAIMFKRNADPLKTTADLRFPTSVVAVSELGITYQWADHIAEWNDEGRFDMAFYGLRAALSGQSFFGDADE